MKPRFAVILTFSLLLFAKSVCASTVFLCGGPQVIQAEVVVSGSNQASLKEVWSWHPEKSAGLPLAMVPAFANTDDCKPVSGGKEVLITSSSNAVALVSLATGKTLFYASVKNAHSAELLPGGFIAVASSSGGDRLLLFDRKVSDKALGYLPLEAAHGVVWDAKREVLWALGGNTLFRLHVDVQSAKPHFEIEKSVPLPAAIGHDLQLAADGSALYVTTTKTVYQVDPGQMSFAPFVPFHGLSEIKSLSVNPLSGQIAYTQADQGVWWTYTLRFLGPDARIVLPSRIYKVRWF